MDQVFVSYSRSDEDVARALAESFAESGLPVWFAGDDIRPGETVAKQVRGALKKASVVVLIIGSEASNWARYEWSEALQRAWTERGDVTIVPVLLPGAEPPAFLAGQSAIRLQQRFADWPVLANAISQSRDIFRWHSAGELPRLDQRLEELRRAAGSIGDESTES